MEKKQLDFNAPLLSVRRFSSTLAPSDGDNGKIIENLKQNKKKSLPSYKSDLELGEVTKPAAVPFMWEQIPGIAKDGTFPRSQPREDPSNTPRLPRGRELDLTRQLSEEKKGFRQYTEASTLNDNAILRESLNKGITAKGDLDFDSGDDAYSDARNTLSPTESFSMSCSFSGLSGYDGQDMKPFRTFAADPHTRDFIMNRFLAAAKAVVVETPQYVTKKLSVPPEEPIQAKKWVSGERKPLLEQYRSITIPQYGQYMEDVESEADGYDDSGGRSTTGCGLFPRFCLNNSSRLLVSVPGMKVRTRAPMYSATEVGRLTRKAFSGPQSQVVDKQAQNATYKNTCNSAVQSQELLKVDDKLVGESNQLNYSSDLHTTNKPSPYRHSRGSISPYRNFARQSPFREGAAFLGVPKISENVKPKSFKLSSKVSNNSQDVSFHQYKQGSGSVSPTVEKMLYIDSVNVVELTSSEAKGNVDFSSKDFETLVKSRGIEETSMAESSVQDARCMKILEGGSIMKQPKASGSEADLFSSFHQSDLRHEAEEMERLRLTRKVHGSGNLDVENEHNLIGNGLQDSNDHPLKSPLPPPLPKSPSESWLWHALPSISSLNSFSNLNFGTQLQSKEQVSKASTGGTKWETIVKSTNLHYDHVRYSEELVPHISQHSKT